MILDSINLFSVKSVHLAGILNPFQVTVLFFVGNKTKEQISKRVLQENKARQNFRKTNIIYLSPITHTVVCIFGGKKCSFFGKFGVLSFLVIPVLRFAFLPYYRRFTLEVFWCFQG